MALTSRYQRSPRQRLESSFSTRARPNSETSRSIQQALADVAQRRQQESEYQAALAQLLAEQEAAKASAEAARQAQEQALGSMSQYELARRQYIEEQLRLGKSYQGALAQLEQQRANLQAQLEAQAADLSADAAEQRARYEAEYNRRLAELNSYIAAYQKALADLAAQRPPATTTRPPQPTISPGLRAEQARGAATPAVRRQTRRVSVIPTTKSRAF